MRRFTFYLTSMLACLIMALSSGCLSGGFKLTRSYARWVNSTHIILRIILYIFTAVVYGVTLLIDVVVFNTMDFWEGRVAKGTYEFEKDNKTYLVNHELQPGTNLKRSTIHIKDENQKQLQEVVLQETATGEVELFVDGTLRTKVTDVSSLPVASIFDETGKKVETRYLWFTPSSHSETLLAGQ